MRVENSLTLHEKLDRLLTFDRVSSVFDTPPDAATVERARQWLHALQEHIAAWALPWIEPVFVLATDEGEVSLEWFHGKRRISAHVSRAGVSYFCYDGGTFWPEAEEADGEAWEEVRARWAWLVGEKEADTGDREKSAMSEQTARSITGYAFQDLAVKLPAAKDGEARLKLREDQQRQCCSSIGEIEADFLAWLAELSNKT